MSTTPSDFTTGSSQKLPESPNYLKLTPEQMAQALSQFVNQNRDRKALAAALANDHPTLQQGTMRLFVAFVQAMAEKAYTDARNERAVELARQITAIWNNDAYGPSLPLI